MRWAHEIFVSLIDGPHRCGACPVSETKGVCAWRIQNFFTSRLLSWENSPMCPHGLNSTIRENVGRVGNVKALWSLQRQNFFTS